MKLKLNSCQTSNVLVQQLTTFTLQFSTMALAVHCVHWFMLRPSGAATGQSHFRRSTILTFSKLELTCSGFPLFCWTVNEPSSMFSLAYNSRKRRWSIHHVVPQTKIEDDTKYACTRCLQVHFAVFTLVDLRVPLPSPLMIDMLAICIR